GTMHERAGTPSSSTRQAPHSPRPQPYFGPLSCRSLRSTCSSGASAGTASACAWPLTVNAIGFASAHEPAILGVHLQVDEARPVVVARTVLDGVVGDFRAAEAFHRGDEAVARQAFAGALQALDEHARGDVALECRVAVGLAAERVAVAPVVGDDRVARETWRRHDARGHQGFEPAVQALRSALRIGDAH